MITAPEIIRTDPVRDFLQNGYAYLPVNASIIQDASEAGTTLIRLCQKASESWALERPGEESEEPDVGLIDTRQEVGKDHKFFFHFTPDLSNLVVLHEKRTSLEMKLCLSTLGIAYRHIGDVMLKFLVELERDKQVFRLPDLASRFFDAMHVPVPFGTTSLRSLLYPDAPEQTGAQDHLDRSTFTGHCGDKNGELYGYVGKEGRREVLSPSPGNLLIFAGVKILWETNGQMKPLKHGSTNVSGTDRQAMVMFGHTDVGYRVRSNKQAFKDFYEFFHKS